MGLTGWQVRVCEHGVAFCGQCSFHSCQTKFSLWHVHLCGCESSTLWCIILSCWTGFLTRLSAAAASCCMLLHDCVTESAVSRSALMVICCRPFHVRKADSAPLGRVMAYPVRRITDRAKTESACIRPSQQRAWPESNRSETEPWPIADRV